MPFRLFLEVQVSSWSYVWLFWADFTCKAWAAEKVDSSPYSEHSSASKMAASTGAHHLQIKEQLWLAERVFQNGILHMGLLFAIKRTIFIGWTISRFRGAFCLLSEVEGTSEADPPRQTLNENWAKEVSLSHLGGDSEVYPERSPGVDAGFFYLD